MVPRQINAAGLWYQMLNNQAPWTQCRNRRIVNNSIIFFIFTFPTAFSYHFRLLTQESIGSANVWEIFATSQGHPPSQCRGGNVVHCRASKHHPPIPILSVNSPSLPIQSETGHPQWRLLHLFPQEIKS